MTFFKFKILIFTVILCFNTGAYAGTQVPGCIENACKTVVQSLCDSMNLPAETCNLLKSQICNRRNCERMWKKAHKDGTLKKFKCNIGKDGKKCKNPDVPEEQCGDVIWEYVESEVLEIVTERLNLGVCKGFKRITKRLPLGGVVTVVCALSDGEVNAEDGKEFLLSACALLPGGAPAVLVYGIADDVIQQYIDDIEDQIEHQNDDVKACWEQVSEEADQIIQDALRGAINGISQICYMNDQCPTTDNIETFLNDPRVSQAIKTLLYGLYTNCYTVQSEERKQQRINEFRGTITDVVSELTFESCEEEESSQEPLVPVVPKNNFNIF